MSNFAKNYPNMLKIISSDQDFPCIACPISRICTNYLDDAGKITLRGEALINNQFGYTSEARETVNLASKCKQNFPNYRVIYEKPKPQHVLVGKGGRVITSANSFWGLIGSVFIITILSCLLIGLIGLIISGIGSLFK